MTSLTSYYGRAKGSFGNIHPAEMAQLGEDWLIAAAAGAGVGLMSAALGGLDKKVFGITVPLDGIAAGIIGVVGLQVRGPTGDALKLASIAAAGSAAGRTFEKFFKAGFKVKGDFEELGDSGFGGYLPESVGFGATTQDALVEAAKYL